MRLWILCRPYISSVHVSRHLLLATTRGLTFVAAWCHVADNASTLTEPLYRPTLVLATPRSRLLAAADSMQSWAPPSPTHALASEPTPYVPYFIDYPSYSPPLISKKPRSRNPRKNQASHPERPIPEAVSPTPAPSRAALTRDRQEAVLWLAACGWGAGQSAVGYWTHENEGTWDLVLKLGAHKAGRAHLAELRTLSALSSFAFSSGSGRRDIFFLLLATSNSISCHVFHRAYSTRQVELKRNPKLKPRLNQKGRTGRRESERGKTKWVTEKRQPASR